MLERELKDSCDGAGMDALVDEGSNGAPLGATAFSGPCCSREGPCVEEFGTPGR